MKQVAKQYFEIEVPKYVQELVEGFTYNYDVKNAQAGYTINIWKPKPYMRMDTFLAKVEKLIQWANKYYADASINYVPSNTHYCKQAIVVTIFDPVMRRLEQYK
jgi:hypothetical protein